MTHPHHVALPYRGDGVARALRETFVADEDQLPLDMVLLLAAIDEPEYPIAPGSAPSPDR